MSGMTTTPRADRPRGRLKQDAAGSNAEIQRLIVSSFKLERCRHHVLRVVDAARARAFLGTLCDRNFVTSAAGEDGFDGHAARNDPWRLNLGFTYQGLLALELPKAFLRVFDTKAPAFTEGVYRRAARRLADTGPSAVQRWEPLFHPSTAHVLLTLHADQQDTLEAQSAEFEALASEGLDGWDTPMDGRHLPNSDDGRGFDKERPLRVHFGFVDGVSDVLSGWGGPNPANPLGEFLLGEPDGAGNNPWVAPSESAEVNAFFRNGSFSVLRKIEQDEAAFRQFVGAEASRLGVDRTYVKAKMLGRWEDGQVVEAGHGAAPAPVPAGTPLDSFGFGTADKAGFGCPMGAHIRRMNPRDDPVVPFRKRPLIRRGMPYGPPYDSGNAAERGLFALFFCANIEDQFEHLVGEWANRSPMGTGLQRSGRDPLIGNHGMGDASFDIPMVQGAPQLLKDLKPFARTRGTLYSFFPSLSAIRTIADGGDKAPAGQPLGWWRSS